MQKKILLFDFDGVIADSFHVAHALAQKICVFLDDVTYRKVFDKNVYDAYKTIRAADHGDPCDHTLDWMSNYVPAFKASARPFEGMPALVRKLSEQYIILIVSSGHNAHIIDFLNETGLASAVAGVYGLETSLYKDQKFSTIFEKYGIAPEETVFVTDTLGDINEASIVHLSSIGVTWGFQDRETLSRGKPFTIVDSPQELQGAIERYFASV